MHIVWVQQVCKLALLPCWHFYCSKMGYVQNAAMW